MPVVGGIRNTAGVLVYHQADVGGGQQWTVSALRPRADVIAYSPTGTLWEATATARPAGGGVPMVPGFTARAGAANYPEP